MRNRRNARIWKKEGVELKAAGGKVAVHRQTSKPRVWRIETAVREIADCQDRDPQANPLVSIDAHTEGLDGLALALLPWRYGLRTLLVSVQAYYLNIRHNLGRVGHVGRLPVNIYYMEGFLGVFFIFERQVLTGAKGFQAIG